jgi:hypothetical protein
MSVYMRFSELAQDANGNWPAAESEREEALRFAEAVLADASVELPDALVMDVGLAMRRGWAVIEANPAWASGIYGCAPNSVLSVLRAACLSEGEKSAIDTRWYRRRCEIED